MSNKFKSICMLLMAVVIMAVFSTSSQFALAQTSESPRLVSTIVAGYDHRYGVVTSPLLSSLSLPERIFISHLNEVFIVDRVQNVIKKVSTTGVTQVIAGNENMGFEGDGQLATSASLGMPKAVHVNQQNEIFIADTGNHRIRQIDASGVIRTVVYNSTEYVSPHAVSHSSLFGVVFLERNLLRGFKDGLVYNLAGIKTKYQYNGDGYGTNSTLYGPSDLFVESNGEILIVDKQNKRIRRLRSDQTLVTIAGGGLEDFKKENVNALNATLDDLGYIVSVPNLGYILFTQGHAVRKLQNGVISTVVGKIDVSGTNATLLSSPRGLAVSSTNILYVCTGDLVRSFDLVNGGTLKTFAGFSLNDVNEDGSDAKTVPLGRVWGVHVTPDNEVYFTETERHKIRKVNTDGTISTVAGFSGVSGYSGESISVATSLLNQPTGVYINSAKEVFFAEPFNYKIRKINSSGNITTLAGDSATTLLLNNVSATESNIEASGFSISGDTMLIADLNNNLIRTVSFKSNLIVTLAGISKYSKENQNNVLANKANLNNPSSIAISKTSGDIFYTDTSGVKKISSTTGNLTIVAGFNSDPSFNGDLTSSNASFNYPRGLFLDYNGTQEILYVADTVNKRVRRIVVADNGLSTVETLFQETYPITGIFVNNGDIYIASGRLIKKYTLGCSTNFTLSADNTSCIFVANSNSTTRDVVISSNLEYLALITLIIPALGIIIGVIVGIVYGVKKSKGRVSKAKNEVANKNDVELKTV